MPWQAADGIFTEEIDGERIVLDSSGNRYLTLNETGSVIFDLATNGAGVDTIVDELVRGWEIDEEDARRATEGFLEKLVAAQILVPS